MEIWMYVAIGILGAVLGEKFVHFFLMQDRVILVLAGVLTGAGTIAGYIISHNATDNVVVIAIGSFGGFSLGFITLGLPWLLWWLLECLKYLLQRQPFGSSGDLEKRQPMHQTESLPKSSQGMAVGFWFF